VKARRVAPLTVGLLLAATSIALAQTGEPGPGADLTIQMSELTATPLVGDAFTLSFEVTNGGPEPASNAIFSSYLPAELELVAIASSDAADECGPGDPKGAPEPASPSTATSDSGSGTATPAHYGGSASCTFETLEAGAARTVAIELRRIGAREIYSSAWVGSDISDPNYDNNYAELFIDADRSRPADVGIALDGPKAPDVGSDFTYTLTVTNAGPSVAETVTLFNPLAYGLTYVSASTDAATGTCEGVDHSEPGTAAPAFAGYTTIVCELRSIEVGESASVEVTANRASAYEIWNSAWLTTSNYDENYENDYADLGIAADPSVTSDLAVQAASPARTPLVGEEFTTSMTVWNVGPSTAGDVWLSNYLPPGVEFVSASPADVCSYDDHSNHPMAEGPATAAPGPRGDAYYPVAPGGVSCAIGSLETGGSFDVTMSLRRTSAREIWNSGWVSSSNHDPNYENNYTDLFLEPDRSNPADLALAMTAPAKPEVGEDFAFQIDVTNNGPSEARNVDVVDYLPYGVELRSAATTDAADVCTYDDGGYRDPPPGSIQPSMIGLRLLSCDLGTMAAGETTSITIDVTRTSEYEIWNSASGTTANYDENNENDYASVLVEGEPYYGVCPAFGTASGTSGDDQVSAGSCPVSTQAGADTVEVVPASTGDSRVRAGSGADIVNLAVSVGSDAPRAIDVGAGAGRDTIRVTVAPGATNAMIFVKGGRGADTIEVDAAPGSRRVTIVVLGGLGNDRVSSVNRTVAGASTAITALGGDGNDAISGGHGDDLLRGGRGGDRLFGDLGNDVMRGGRGHDVCRGGPGTNRTYGC